jgi:hypothetical protein
MSRGWLGVVSAEHVARGFQLGIAQINHGKKAPLARMHAGDTALYYSPTIRRGVPDGYQSFTAISTLPADEIWQADEGVFKPFRRRCNYESSKHVPVSDLRDQLAFTAGPRWGHQPRFGPIELESSDIAILREVMAE